MPFFELLYYSRRNSIYYLANGYSVDRFKQYTPNK